MEVYAQQVALQQLKDENLDRARLAQKLAELEVRQRKCKRSWDVQCACVNNLTTFVMCILLMCCE